ncbi:ran-binding protein M homolog [Vicia villosa]|uniref:ran-binding protein M homolog n=1 Tax=Vicia villosa TaxID=3911 RepID=UPI00273C6C22|nr:ran-binding protein M homolog [Vicia villosa]
MKETNGNNSVEKPDQEQDLGLYFLELCRRKVKEELEDYDGDDEKEESPTELNTLNSSGGFVVVATDKLSVKYVNVNLHGHDVGVIQANRVAPMKRIVYYFEITVKDAGVKGQVSIGFTTENFKMRRQPGWEANSCGYHGDDGLLYRGQGKGENFGPTYTTGDIVGAGINYAAQEFFFTKNGRVIGTVYKDMKGPLFPTVAVHSQNEEVHVNFGQKPFTFDLKEFEAQERMKQQVKIEDIPVVPNASYGIVRSYLLHYGYEDTLDSFDLASRSTVPPINIVQDNGNDDQETTYALNHRKTLRQLIRGGEIDDAFGKLREWYPQIAEDNTSAMCFLLHCQKFIELVRVGALEEAVKYGRIELSSFFGSPVFEDLVQECVALLAYERPSESAVGYLLKDSQREIVADTVNAMILSTNPNLKEAKNCLHSHLERLLRQLTASCLERRSLSGNQGEAFQLQRVLISGKRS